MNIEKLKQNHNLKIMLITLILLTLITILCGISFAKYRSSKSINIAKGTINYSPADLSIMAVYIENDDGNYTRVTDGKVPSNGYSLNTNNTKTRCEINGEIDNNIKLTYNYGEISVSGVTNSGTKCYFYFDKQANAADKIPEGKPTDDNMFAGIEGDGVYTWTKGDYSGGNQPIKYYRGNVNNNWVVFGKDGDNYIWWRIIRNNSNGSLRMIYAGTSSSKTSAPATTGPGTQIGTKAYNTTYNNNMYVGFKYDNGVVHGTGTASTILGASNSTDKTTLYGWYNSVLKTNYGSYIDENAGFCNDRQPSTSDTSLNGLGGTGTTTTYYAASMRITTTKVPTLLCNNAQDIFKTPIGLITADEILMAGLTRDTTNAYSYLYTNRDYWSMTPWYFYSSEGCVLFHATENGYLSNGNVMTEYRTDASLGVRPVINLTPNTNFISGNGEATTPFVVEGT